MVKYELGYPELTEKEEKLIAKSKGENYTEIPKQKKSNFGFNKPNLSKLGKNILPSKHKQIFKSSKLQVKIPYKKGDLLLKQKNAFFKDGYEKRDILSW